LIFLGLILSQSPKHKQPKFEMCPKNAIKRICFEQAEMSPCSHKLGAVITKGRSKIIFRSHNTNLRTTFLHKITCCQHAEMGVATQFFNRFWRRNQLKVSQEKKKAKPVKIHNLGIQNSK